jgi:hypothetical protein
MALRAPIRSGFAVLALYAAAGCVAKHEPSATEDALPEVDVEDPDPDKDTDSPKFCNPAGKQGAELDKCLEFNETFYKKFDDDAKKREPWFNFTPDSWASVDELDEKYVLKVIAETEAVQRLEKAPYVELSPGDVERFTGHAAAFAGMKPFLVRGLLYHRATGAFSVFEKDQSILVRHDSIGDETIKETRSAVVVFLSAAPKTVYVDCGVGG